ncbi:MAG TPA: hypothetical protein VII92_13360, partial [Anaerolineae bacterium]
EAVARRLFEQAGFERISVYPLRELARTYMPELMVADVSFLLVAHKEGETAKDHRDESRTRQTKR